MATEVIVHLGFFNLAAGLAILLVLPLRRPARALFGAETAYLLWLLPVAAGLAALLPARAAEPGVAAAHRFMMSGDHAAFLGRLWAVGALLALALLAWSQARFMARARSGEAGPAVVGVFSPRMIVPRDYQARFTEAERAVIRAHERAHIERQDPRANAAMALIQCLAWFNPLVHLAIREARLDQELACDARVMGRLSRARGLYARTLLKTQLDARVLPLGCHWPAATPHPLEERVAMLARPQPSLHRTAMGVALMAAMSLSVGAGAWSTQPEGPPRPVVSPVKWPVVIYTRISVASEP